MNISLLKKYPVLSVSVAISLVLLIAMGVKLVSLTKAYYTENHALRAAMGRLQQLYHRNPYPSEENIEIESENYDKLLEAYKALNEKLSTGKIDPQQMEAADFMPLLENTLRRIRNCLDSTGIIFPPDYDFSFEKYATGQLPTHDDIPRLVQQLKIIEKLCELLSEANITELISVSREEFEAAAAVIPGRRGRAAAQSENKKAQPEMKKPYDSQHFTIVFRATESTAMDVLNRLAKDLMFSIVTYVEMKNMEHPTGKELTSVLPLKKKATPATPGRGDEEHGERQIIIGKEKLEVKIELDVYRFASHQASGT